MSIRELMVQANQQEHPTGGLRGAMQQVVQPQQQRPPAYQPVIGPSSEAAMPRFGPGSANYQLPQGLGADPVQNMTKPRFGPGGWDNAMQRQQALAQNLRTQDF